MTEKARPAVKGHGYRLSARKKTGGGRRTEPATGEEGAFRYARIGAYKEANAREEAPHKTERQGESNDEEAARKHGVTPEN